MSARSRLVGSSPDTRAMLLLLLCSLAVAAAAPYYDQRQEGESNYRADVQNVVFLIALPKKVPTSIFEGLFKNSKQHNEEDAQDRSDIQVMEAFVEPSKPYGVEISSEADGRAVEVVIAGRRRMESEIQPEKDEFKLIGATEQCGPDRQRDPVTLMCIAARSTHTPEVVMSSA